MFKKYIFIIISVFLFTSCFSSNNDSKTEINSGSVNTNSGNSLEKGSCIAVITSAIDPQTGKCSDYPSPCDVPEGYKVLDQNKTCSEYNNPNTQTGTIETQTGILNENNSQTKTGTIKTTTKTTNTTKTDTTKPTSKDSKTEEQVVKEFEGELDSLFKLIEENAK